MHAGRPKITCAPRRVSSTAARLSRSTRRVSGCIGRTLSPKKLRVFVNSRTFVIQTSIKPPYFHWLKIGAVTAIIEHV